MFLTNILFKPKAKYVMVLMRSTGSSHVHISFRERLEEKREIIRRDPLIERDCVYKEVKKIRSMKWPIKISKENNSHTYGILPEEILQKV